MRKLKLLLLTGLLCSVQFLWAQTQITGRVTDKEGLPMQGVTVSVQNHNEISTTTGPDGTYSISVPPSSNLIFSYVGYQNVQQAATSSPLNVTLVQGNNAMTEVVVVGYGTRIRKDMTSSVAKITNKDFQNLPLPSFESALQGRAAGVYINQGSGKLGQGLNIRVRGISSISANSQPFVVIDGVPVVSQALGSATEPDNPLATLNPDDIESIEVLKDAASAAIYGARASNGVILVTTKSGKAGKTKINAGYFHGWSDATHIRKFLNAQQYRELFTEAAKNSSYNYDLNPTNQDAFFNNPADAYLYSTGLSDWTDYPNVDHDWTKESFQKGYISQYNLSLTGGDSKTKFLFSGSYNDQKGIILGNRLTRANGRLNLDHSVSSRIRIGTNLSLSRSQNFRVPDDNAFSNPVQLNALPPIEPKYDSATGKLNSNTLYYNNLIDQQYSTNVSTTYRSISNAYGELTISPSLLFRSQVGLDWNNLQEEQYLGKETLDGAPTGWGYNNQVTATVVTYTNTLNFKKSFFDVHNVDALAGIEYQKGTTSGVTATGRGFPSDRFTKIVSAAIKENASSTETGFAFASYFARGNYKFKDRYLLGASFRVDGSSRFGKDNRYGIFPAASAGWILSEENFLKDSKAISFLKLRGSYGRTGNAEIGNFSSLTLYSAAAYADVAGLIASQIGTPNLSWERTDQMDIGIDYGFLNNRINGEIDYFNKDTKDLLLNVPLPSVNGFSTITKNIGSMTNKGWEFVINANILTGAFKWNVSGNISTYKNKITKLVAPVPPNSSGLGRLAVGQPFGQFYGKKFLGADPANGDALYLGADGKPTNDYAAAVDTILGDPNPKYYGGFNTHFSYKGFDLDVQTQFVEGNDIFNIAGVYQSVNGDFYDNQTVDQMNYWRKPGDITMVPQPRLLDGNGTGKSSRWIEDGSYLRIKTVNLGYNIPRAILTRYHIENARLYVAASNLFTFTKYTGYDPELNTSGFGAMNLGHDFYTPPQIRTISVGINLGL